MQQRKIKTGAFTLLEVLVALLITAIALIVLLRLQIVSITMSDHAYWLSQATLLADAKMAEVIAAEYSEIRSGSGSVGEETGNITLHWETTITDVSLKQLEDIGQIGLRNVCVQVIWNEGHRQNRVQLATYIAGNK